MIASRAERLSGWGRHPVQECRVYRPEKVSELGEVMASPPEGGVVSRGLGRAYGDAALNPGGTVVSHLRLNRMLAFDEAAGVLECEGGVSLGEIVDAFLPRGWFLPVVPGTRHVTIGGAIAADVHGKNHHRDGTFGRFVDAIRLVTPGRGMLTCSREQEADAFRATLGGMGLTGAIVSARLRLTRVESAWMTVDQLPTRDLDDALARFADADAGHRYSVAWIDALAKGRALGRGVLMQGDHAPASAAPAKATRRTVRGVPFDLPGATLNRFTVGAFNRLYRATHGARTGAMEPLERFFWPLDAVADWNRAYGRRGFVQYQLVVPIDRADALASVLRRAAESGRASFLAVLKRFGPAGEGILSFPMAGWTLSLDFPVASGLTEMLREMDRTVADAGGRVYLAKDAMLDAVTFARMYPAAEAFRAVRRTLDPAGVLTSSLARRVGLA
ncbi:MAG TPA: FAD-binding oxidoreductase [Longimicrobium sp.]|jgi:FAD/FMN-containing dehydrogenase|nr:FAD-binding oxidoreductase [Longimicrobium sp.]